MQVPEQTFWDEWFWSAGWRVIPTFAFARDMARTAYCSSSDSEGVKAQKVDNPGPSPGQLLVVLPKQWEPDSSIQCLPVRHPPSHHLERTLGRPAQTAPQTHGPAGSSPPEEPQTPTAQAKDIRHPRPMGSWHRRPCMAATCSNQCYPSCYCGGYPTPKETTDGQSTAMETDPNANRRCCSRPAAGSC